MPRLVCRSCGMTVYTTAPFEALFADERRCPRCGQLTFTDRRTGVSRRTVERRAHPGAETPPPLGTTERRAGERRKKARRHDDQNPFQREDDSGMVE